MQGVVNVAANGETMNRGLEVKRIVDACQGREPQQVDINRSMLSMAVKLVWVHLAGEVNS